MLGYNESCKSDRISNPFQPSVLANSTDYWLYITSIPSWMVKGSTTWYHQNHCTKIYNKTTAKERDYHNDLGSNVDTNSSPVSPVSNHNVERHMWATQTIKWQSYLIVWVVPQKEVSWHISDEYDAITQTLDHQSVLSAKCNHSVTDNSKFKSRIAQNPRKIL